MHVLFVHQNFPAQFGHVAQHLIARHNFRCTYVSEKPGGRVGSIEMIQYKNRGGATNQTHYCSRTFENCVWHAHAVYEALRARPDIRPDLVVGHSGLGSTVFLRELYPAAAVVNYFEYFYRTTDSDIDFRPDFPSEEQVKLRARARNAMLLLDLDNCDLGYSPTNWQRGRFPAEYMPKIRVIFDGIDTNLWKPQPGLPRRLGKLSIPEGMKVVTYATRGMESMRGFDIFMRFAKKLCDRRKDVMFLIAGQDRICYGGDEKVTGSKSFKEWVLKQDNYDLSRFTFVGLLPPPELAKLFCLTDLHVYLTVPFVLSWSLLNALACGSTVLASDTAPVREVIEDGRTGLLAGFFDVDGMVGRAEEVLDHPDRFRHLGQNGAGLIRDQYSLDVCLPKMVELYREAAGRRSNPPQPAAT
jgi:glycosyltransferase involved in cell wall biosynthesis